MNSVNNLKGKHINKLIWLSLLWQHRNHSIKVAEQNPIAIFSVWLNLNQNLDREAVCMYSESTQHSTQNTVLITPCVLLRQSERNLLI